METSGEVAGDEGGRVRSRVGEVVHWTGSLCKSENVCELLGFGRNKIRCVIPTTLNSIGSAEGVSEPTLWNIYNGTFSFFAIL